MENEILGNSGRSGRAGRFLTIPFAFQINIKITKTLEL
jgi:hypothetical protein